MSSRKRPAKLILKDGSCFSGYSFGDSSIAAGEVVFNTGMVGYPETLTDPSYRGQILVMTYPLVGNYGVPGDTSVDGLLANFESERIHVRGLIVACNSDEYSHWAATRSLSEWMIEQGIPGIYGIDTRQLTKLLREHGTMLGKMIHDDQDIKFEDPLKTNLVKEVSVAEPVEYGRGKKRIVLVDCGTKNSIVRSFTRRGLSVLRCPWDYPISDERAAGIVISNGPGDPKMCKETIANVRVALSGDVPILGICLGSQILALAAGADTYKLKYGHRSQNQPCVETGTRRCYITSQNHSYAVDADTLPEDWREWFYNSNDGTNEGILHISRPLFGAQFHPEASPGPDDSEFLFDMFVRAMK